MAGSHGTGHVARVRGRSGRTSRGRQAWAAALVALLVGCMPVGVAAGSPTRLQERAAARAWTVEPTPNPAGSTIVQLSAVACVCSSACTAVGSRAASLSDPSLALVERWDGTHWRVQPTPLPPRTVSAALAGVACPSEVGCTAVGSVFRDPDGPSLPLAETWDGDSWRGRVMPNPANSTSTSVQAVSCTSQDACTAAGFFATARGRTRALAERWDGSRWVVQRVPQAAQTRSAQFMDVSCAAADACTAVGYQDNGAPNARPLAAMWNGTSWRLLPMPLPRRAPGRILSAVSCTAADRCTATGATFSTAHPTLAERWNGTGWRRQPTPLPRDADQTTREIELTGVSCRSPRSCTAIGAYAPGGRSAYFLEAWDGARWRMARAPHPTGFVAGALNGVSCVVGRCSAVGAWSGGPVSVATLAIAD